MDAILCATDGSERASQAFERALEIAQATGADLHLLHVVDRKRHGEPALSSGELLVIEREDEGTALMQRLAERARDAGVGVEMRSRRGDPAEEIIEKADADDVDMIVIGSRGTDHQCKLGTVARRIVEGCERPRMLV